MKVNCVWEHNGNDSIIYANNYIGAFARGASKEEAMLKMPEEIRRFQLWRGEEPLDNYEIDIVQEKESGLQVRDADSDVLFATEKDSLSAEEYQHLKTLAMKSAEDFYSLYNSFPDKHKSALPYRKTFYGSVPRTAEEMYQHTKNVNEYYSPKSVWMPIMKEQSFHVGQEALNRWNLSLGFYRLKLQRAVTMSNGPCERF